MRACADDGHPAVGVEAQNQMRPRDQWIGDAHVGVDVAADHHVGTGWEGMGRSLIPDGELGGR